MLPGGLGGGGGGSFLGRALGLGLALLRLGLGLGYWSHDDGPDLPYARPDGLIVGRMVHDCARAAVYGVHLERLRVLRILGWTWRQ